jgi:hypothetical protein
MLKNKWRKSKCNQKLHKKRLKKIKDNIKRCYLTIIGNFSYKKIT